MTPSAKHTPGGSGRTLRWRRYGAILAAVLVFYALDAYLKSGDVVGFLPASAAWSLQAADLPDSWARWQQSPTHGALRQKAPGALQAVAVSLRKMTGVRPTPARLGFWLGDSALIGGGPEGWCLSVRPGLALRAASLFTTPPLKPGAGEAPFWRDYASGWREGCLLVASSTAYLDEVLANGQPVPLESPQGDALTFAWNGEQPGAMGLRVEPGLPLRIELPQSAPSPQAAAFDTSGWGEAMLSVSSHGEHMPALLRRAADTVLAHEPAAATWNAAKPLATDWWAAYCPLAFQPLPESEPWALGVISLDLKPDIPTMELIVADRGAAGGLWSPDPAGSPQVHRWNDTEGLLLPIPDAARAWAIAETPEARILASHEHLMPLALEHPPVHGGDTVARMEIQWQPFAQTLAAMARRAAEEELLPGMNRDDVSRDVVPVLEALQDWGTLQWRLFPEGDGLRGEGYLARDAGQH